MKKFLMFLLVVLVLGLGACGNETTEEAKDDNTNPPADNSGDNNQGNENNNNNQGDKPNQGGNTEGDSNCSHANKEYKYYTVNSCGTTFYYEECSCGYLYIFDVNFECDDDNMDTGYDTDENGNEYQWMTMSCPDCGYDVYATSHIIMDEDSCHGVANYVYTFSKDGEVVYTAYLSEEGYRHSNGSEKELDFTIFGACGGTINGYYCPDCNLFDYVDNMTYCKTLVETEIDYTDANGVIHEGALGKCNVCGLEIRNENTIKYINGECEYVESQTRSIKVGDTVLYEETYTYFSNEHEYEETYTKLGETCADGVRVDGKCSKCGKETTSVTTKHMYSSDTTDLNKYGVCNSGFEIFSCDVCGEKGDGNVFFVSCSYVKVKEETIVIDGVEHILIEEECDNCHVIKKSDKVFRSEKGCYLNYDVVYEYIMNGQSILTFTSYESVDNHNYEITKNFLGSSCADGVDITYHCLDCGMSMGTVQYSHSCEEEIEKISNKYNGMCNTTIHSGVCKYCEQMVNYYPESECSWEIVSETIDLKQERCITCGATRRTKLTGLPTNSSCSYHYQYDITYYYNGNVIKEYVWHSYFTQHDLYTSYTRLGETCEDGIHMEQYCNNINCGYYYEDTYYYHQEVLLYSLDKEPVYGACSNHHLDFYGCICGKELRYETDLDYVYESGYHYYYECSYCPLKLDVTTEIEVIDGQMYKYTYYSVKGEWDTIYSTRHVYIVE